MTITAVQVLEMWRDGFASGNADPVAEILTDDFLFVGSDGATRSKEETLQWVSTTPELVMSDFEVLYENEDVLVGAHSVVRSGGRGNGTVMFFARKEIGKISYWRVQRSTTTE